MAIHPALLDLVRELMSPKHLDFVALRRACDVDGLTPLLFNIQYGAVDLVEELLSLGADDAVQDDAGLGVLDYASLVPTEATRERLTDIFLRRHRSFVLRERLQDVASQAQTVVELPRRF